MCTTFLCYNLVKHLLSDPLRRTRLTDYPNLIRLNPNIPWKTRGNAALAIRLRTRVRRSELFETCKRFVSKFATSPRANSGLVLLAGKGIPDAILDFSKRALYSVLSLREARNALEDFQLDYFSLRSGQGLIGALAAVGNPLPKDHTYELISYRKDVSLPRAVEKQKVLLMSKLTFPETFSSYDSKFDRVMIAPHGPDPVLCGVRGESPTGVKEAFGMLLPIDNLQGWMIFRSNQGTGEHLTQSIDLGDVRSFVSGKVIGMVSTRPKTQIGGHVFFTINNKDGEIGCACYEPTGSFRKLAMSLIAGDEIEVGGGVRRSTAVHPKILNLEYFRPIRLARKLIYRNPICPKCLTSMSSNGRSQGFKCKKCGYENMTPRREVELPRELFIDVTYSPPIKAHRHLTRPEQRNFVEKKAVALRLIAKWLE